MTARSHSIEDEKIATEAVDMGELLTQNKALQDENKSLQDRLLRALAEAGAAFGIEVIPVGRPELDLASPETVASVLAAAGKTTIVSKITFGRPSSWLTMLLVEPAAPGEPPRRAP